VDVGASWGWSIRGATGIEYVFVAASFIASTAAESLATHPRSSQDLIFLDDWRKP